MNNHVKGSFFDDGTYVMIIASLGGELRERVYKLDRKTHDQHERMDIKDGTTPSVSACQRRPNSLPLFQALRAKDWGKGHIILSKPRKMIRTIEVKLN